MRTIKNRHRHRYDRDKLRYPSDLTDWEWAHIKPLIPPAKRGGGKRCVDIAHSGDLERSIRSIVNTDSGDHERPLAVA